MLGVFTRRIYEHNASLINRGFLSERVRAQLWKAARKEALKRIDREGQHWYRAKLADLVDRRDHTSQPKFRARKKHWKHGPGRKAIWPRKN